MGLHCRLHHHEVRIAPQSVSQSVTMRSLGILLGLSVILAGANLVSGSCSKSEYATMQATFANCSSEQNTEDICQLLESVVEKCGKHWLACHSQSEVGEMRDLHINHLIKSYQDNNNLENCRVVAEYRMSGRSEGAEEEDVLCDDDTTSAVLKKLGDCSHTISTEVYTNIQDLTSVSTISAKLCTALSAIGTVCVKDLKQCFATDDLLQMRKSHLDEMKSFLLRISQGKVSENALDNCKILDYTEHVEDQLSQVTDVIESQSDTTTVVAPRARTTTTTTTTATTTTTTTTTEGIVQVKGSRSAQFDPVHNSEDDEDMEDDDEEEDTSTEAAERLHSRNPSSSSRPAIHSVIILVLSVLSI